MKDDSAAVAMVTAFGILIMFFITGFAIDSARAYYVRERLITSLDAAALAGARDILLQPADVQDKAIRYFWANFPAACSGTRVTDNLSCSNANSLLGSTFNITSSYVASGANPNCNPCATLVAGNTQLAVTATVQLPPAFMFAHLYWNNKDLFGFGNINVSDTGTAGLLSMELTMVLDNTGSMSAAAGSTTLSKMGALHCAAINLLRGLYNVSTQITNCTDYPNLPAASGSTASYPNIWVNILPSVAGVNIGQQNSAWVDWTGTGVTDGGNSGNGAKATAAMFAADAAGSSCHNGKNTCGTVVGGAVPGWKGCVEARPGPDGTYEDANAEKTPTDQLWTPYFWAPTATYTSATTSIANEFNAQYDGSTTPKQIQVTISGKNYNVGGDNNWMSGHAETINYGTIADEYSNAATSGTGPNLGCGAPIAIHLTQEGAAENAILAMYPVDRAGTLDNLGLAWGWRSLSPNWQGVWDNLTAGDGTALPLPYNKSQKIIIILTDGLNNPNDDAGDELGACTNGTVMPLLPNSGFVAEYSAQGFSGYTCSDGSTPGTNNSPFPFTLNGKKATVPADGLPGNPLTNSTTNVLTNASTVLASDGKTKLFTSNYTVAVTNGIQNGADYNAYGRLGNNSILVDPSNQHVYDYNTALTAVNAKQAALCTAMKNLPNGEQPIKIFSIILGTDAPIGSATANLFQNCASNPTINVGFFDPANTDNLNQVFQSILTQLSVASIVG
jgi:hypothetical protein